MKKPRLNVTLDRPYESVTTCPHCAYVAEIATGIVHRKAPKPGSYSICIRCAQWSKFNESLALVPLSTDEDASLPDELRAIARAVTEVGVKSGRMSRS